MIDNLHPDNTDFLHVAMATPELGDYCVQFAGALGMTLLETLRTCAKATIPAGERAGFMAGALRHLWEKRKSIPLSVPNPESLYFCETMTGEVFWKEIA